jgi:hypothetical protein
MFPLKEPAGRSISKNDKFKWGVRVGILVVWALFQGLAVSWVYSSRQQVGSLSCAKFLFFKGGPQGAASARTTSSSEWEVLVFGVGVGESLAFTAS